MNDLKLQSSNQIRVGKWQERFLIKRIDEDDIQITLTQRDAILKALNQGQKFIQVGKYTLMLNAIKSIDPKYGEKNIPPKPDERWETELIEGKGVMTLLNKEEIEEWEKIFGNGRI